MATTGDDIRKLGRQDETEEIIKKKVCVQDYPLTCLTHGLESKSHSKRFTGRYSHIAKAQEGSRVTIAILAD